MGTSRKAYSYAGQREMVRRVSGRESSSRGEGCRFRALNQDARSRSAPDLGPGMVMTLDGCRGEIRFLARNLVYAKTRAFTERRHEISRLIICISVNCYYSLGSLSASLR